MEEKNPSCALALVGFILVFAGAGALEQSYMVALPLIVSGLTTWFLPPYCKQINEKIKDIQMRVIFWRYFGASPEKVAPRMVIFRIRFLRVRSNQAYHRRNRPKGNVVKDLERAIESAHYFGLNTD